MRKPSIAAIVAIAICALCGGCAALGIDGDHFIGTWKLSSVSYAGGVGTTITQDATVYGLAMTIVARSDYTQTTSTTSGGATTADSGTWSKGGSTYTLTNSASVSSTGTISSDYKTFSMTKTDAGKTVTLLFAKQ
jgi:hypothetical protein